MTFGTYSIKFLLILSCASIFACGAAKRASAGKVKAESARTVLKNMSKLRIDTQNFAAKAKVKYDDGEQKVSFVAQIRIDRGSYIWVNATFIAFEVARVMIRPDSIFALNRMDKTYLAQSYAEFQSSHDIPASYHQLEELLIGNSLVHPELPYAFQFDGEAYLFEQMDSVLEVTERIDARSYQSKQLSVADMVSNYVVTADYGDYRLGFGSEAFSYGRQYIIKKDNVYLSNIQINYTDVGSNEKKAPFEIPKHYERSE